MTARRFAERLIDHAQAVMPEHRREWAAAMRAEFAALPDGRERLAWAVGCVWASYRERIEPMQVFVKSLVRAAAVWLVLLAFVSALIVLDPRPATGHWGWNIARVLVEFYCGMFATLWVCEVLIARFWASPGKLFKKTLARTIALWLWPMGLEVYTLIRALNYSPVRAYIDANAWAFARRTLIDFTGHGGGSFIGIFVPLLVCELIITRVWKPRSRLPA